LKQQQLQTLLKTPASWLAEGGEESELVLSTRVRLARNIDGRTFTHCAEASELDSTRNEVRDALGLAPSMKDSVYFDMNEITEPERMILAEKRLISQDMVGRFTNRALAVVRGEKLSVMINDEDHLRLQSFEAGLALNEAFERVSRLDDELDGSLEFAFSDQFGYLTACATNVGTGLRVSVMLHLPGLVHNGDIRQVSDGLRNVRLNIISSYTEEGEAAGNLFQISNSITLGLSELDTVKNMDAHVRKVIEFEKKARETLLKEARSLLEDKIWRAYGLLRNARMLGSREAMGLISAVRLGRGLGIITETGLSDLNEMLIMIQPMHLQMLYEKVMGPDERDRRRADYIRSRLKAS